ncbi:MAG: type II toxin-antitoxin system PemK/MazF family toxin [Sporichthyaceae bacterium]
MTLSTSRPQPAPWQVWWVDFEPRFGHEQGGHRPAIVASTGLSCRLPNNLVFVIPCTTRVSPLDTRPRIDLGKPGSALCDHLRAIDVRRLDRLHPATPTAGEIAAIKSVLRKLISVG